MRIRIALLLVMLGIVNLVSAEDHNRWERTISDPFYSGIVTTKKLLSWCEGDENDQALCNVYLAAVVDTKFATGKFRSHKKDRAIMPICFPDGDYDVKQLRKVIVGWVAANPTWNISVFGAAETALVAFAETFKCKK
jgi:hypothetical protein